MSWVDSGGDVYITSGNVGIGVISPGEKLEVAGNIVLGNGNYLYFGSASGASVQGDNTNTNLNLRASNSLKLLQGGSNSFVAEVGYNDFYKKARLRSVPLYFNTNDASSIQDTGTNSMAFTVPGGSYFLFNNGNVGIGTTSPEEKLEVSGNIKASGNVIIPSTGKVYLSGAGGARYMADNTTQGWIDVVGKLAVGGGFGFTGVTFDTDGTIRTNGNLHVRRDGDPGDVTLLYLGRTEDTTYQGSTVPRHTNYLFWQNRFNKDGWYWGGWNTFRHPATVPGAGTVNVEDGYGYYPFRNWGKNVLLEANGAIVSKKYLVAPQLIFQNPRHVDLVDGAAKSPNGYDRKDHPYLTLTNPAATATTTGAGGAIPNQDDGPINSISVDTITNFQVGDEVLISKSGVAEINVISALASSPATMSFSRGSIGFATGATITRVRELGGIQHNTADFDVKIVRDGSHMVLYDGIATAGKQLSDLVMGASGASNLKVDSGETSSYFSIAASARSSDPLTTIYLNTTFSDELNYVVILTPRNSADSWGVTLEVKDRTTSSFTVIARNNDPNATASFYIQWLAIGT